MELFVCVFKLADDRMALVSGISLDPEAAIGVTKKLPPKWIEGVDEVKQICVDTSMCTLTIVLQRKMQRRNTKESLYAAPDYKSLLFRSSMKSHGFGRR